jgi:hypothetical protein
LAPARALCYDGGVPRSRWTSFVAPETARGRRVRQLEDEANPRHRLRVEHDARTLLIHLSDEDGPGWTTVAVDRATRLATIVRAPRQLDAARGAYEDLDRLRQAKPVRRTRTRK